MPCRQAKTWGFLLTCLSLFTPQTLVLFRKTRTFAANYRTKGLTGFDKSSQKAQENKSKRKAK